MRDLGLETRVQSRVPSPKSRIPNPGSSVAVSSPEPRIPSLGLVPLENHGAEGSQGDRGAGLNPARQRALCMISSGGKTNVGNYRDWGMRDLGFETRVQSRVPSPKSRIPKSR